MADSGKYADIIGPGGEYPGGPIWDDGGPYGGGGSGPGGGSSGFPNPFIPNFSGGQAQGFGGFGASDPWGGGGGVQRRRLAGMGRMAFGGGQQGASPFGAQSAGSSKPLIQHLMQQLTNSQGNNPFANPTAGGAGPWTPKNAYELIGDIIGGGKASQGMNGGAIGVNPPPGILAAIRSQGSRDAGARERSARLGVQSQAARGESDPSTFGFQALMSQLGGQDQTARSMSQADLGLRQQQLAFLQNLLGQYLGSNVSLEGQNRQSRAAWEAGGGRSGLGQAAGIAGQAAGAYFGGGGGGGGGAQPPRMGQSGFQYPYYGG